MSAVTEINCYQLICWDIGFGDWLYIQPEPILSAIKTKAKKTPHMWKKTAEMFDILVTQTFLKLTSVDWRFTSALITSKLVKNDCNFIPGKSEFFRRITQLLTRYCWWRAKYYSFTFISLTSSLPTFFSNLVVTNTLSQPNMHLCARLFTTLFFPSQLINATTQVTNLRWVILFLCQSNVHLHCQLWANCTMHRENILF